MNQLKGIGGLLVASPPASPLFHIPSQTIVILNGSEESRFLSDNNEK